MPPLLTILPKANFLITVSFSLIISFSFFPLCQAIVEIPNLDLSSTTLDPIKTGLTLKGTTSNDKLGAALSSAGDINGDGYADIIIGSIGFDSSKGAAYVRYGHPSFSSSTYSALDLTALDPKTTGFRITGNAAGDNLGFSVRSAGDVNNDGYDDIIIGAPFKSSSQGQAYVVYGGPTSSRANIDLEMTSLDPGTTGFTITGGAAGDYFGRTVSGTGDIDNDGYDDIMIGAPSKSSAIGAVYVIYGGPTSSRININLASMTMNPASTGFRIMGQGSGNSFGRAISAAGNVNNDDYDDIIIGAPNLDSNKGAAYVIYGRDRSLFSHLNLATTALDPATTGFAMAGAGGYFGISVDTAGDINQDGYDDILVGAYDGNGLTCVIYGRQTSELSHIIFASTTLDPQTTGFTVTDTSTSEHIGYVTRTAGDVNGDGYSDIIVSQDLRNSLQGAAYVIYGGPKASRQNIDVGITALDPASTGFMIIGNSAGDKFGYALSGAGDINGDGYDDVMVGTYLKDSSKGAVYVMHSSCVSSSGSTCQERVFCKSCAQGYLATNSKCQSCPSNCQEYNGLTTCQTCDDGYIISNKQCVVNYSIQKGVTSTLGSMSSAFSAVGGALSIGSSLFPVTKLVSKIVQNTRYIGLTVTEELKQVYENWNTDLINVDLPDAFSSLAEFKTLSSEFSRYDIESAFLVNFWSSLVILGVIVLTWIVSHLLKKFLPGYAWVSRISAGLFNFMLVQAYGCLDDVIFYFVLDVQTNPFDNEFSWMSFFSGLGFLGLVGLLVLWNILIVKRYQKAKSNNSTEIFTKNNKRWELFYGDFNDGDIWSHSFLAILAVRNCLSSVIISGFYNYPLLQTSLLVIIDGGIIIILMTLKPLCEKQAKLTQYFYELVALLVHLCTFILAMEGDQVSVEKIEKIFFCKAIIFLNYGLTIGGVCLMLAEIYKGISPKIKNWRLKRKQKLERQRIVLEEDSVNQSVLSAVQAVNLSTKMGENQLSAEGNHQRQPWISIKRARIQRQPQMESNFERPFENIRKKENNVFSMSVRRDDDMSQNSAIRGNENMMRKEALGVMKQKKLQSISEKLERTEIISLD